VQQLTRLPSELAVPIERTRVTPKTSRGCREEVASWPSGPQDAVASRLLEFASDGAPDVAAHMDRTARLALALIDDLDLCDPLAHQIVLTARLHDIGKLAIPPWILEKPNPLTEYELGVMQEHSVIGQRMLERSPELLAVASHVRATHERWDGDGYPDRLSGAEIPLPARIVAVCDAFDAMTKPRVYSASMSIDSALHELERCSGTQFDPGVVAVFGGLFGSRFDRWAKGA
jgi:two-component system, cell cycle response regulator